MLQNFMDSMERLHAALHAGASPDVIRERRAEMDAAFKLAVSDIVTQHSMACSAAMVQLRNGKAA